MTSPLPNELREVSCGAALSREALPACHACVEFRIFAPMDWYYANNGQQAGPVSDSNLDELARTGAIKPDTLVWSQGMSGWLPYSTARGAATTLNAPPTLDQAVCCGCDRPFSKNDLLRFDNNYVCAQCKPTFLQRMREGVGPAGGLAWRSGDLLVLRREATLPDRCVKCNAPAQGRKLTRKFSWHTPWLYLIILVGLLFYIIAALVMSKKARVDIGICEAHFNARKRDILIGWLTFLFSIGLFVAAGYFSNGWFVLVGVGFLLGGLIYAAIRVPVLSPKRIDENFVYLKGASPAYIAELPEFPGTR